VREVTGVWRDMTESVNSMASKLTAQVGNNAPSGFVVLISPLIRA
jgi:hypothetical protein